MSTPEYFSSQILTTTINIEPRNIKGDISKLVLYNLKKRYEGVCNKDGYIKKDSIELARVKTGLVCYDHSNKKLIKLPHEFIKQFS